MWPVCRGRARTSLVAPASRRLSRGRLALAEWSARALRRGMPRVHPDRSCSFEPRRSGIVKPRTAVVGRNSQRERECQRDDSQVRGGDCEKHRRKQVHSRPSRAALGRAAQNDKSKYVGHGAAEAVPFRNSSPICCVRSKTASKAGSLNPRVSTFGVLDDLKS